MTQLKFSSLSCHKWLEGPPLDRDNENDDVANVSLDENHGDPTLGYRFVGHVLEMVGYLVSERRIWRLRTEQ